MRPADIGAYFALRRHVTRPWGFVRLRKLSPSRPFFDLTLRDGGNFRLRPQDRHVFYGVFGRDEYRLNNLGHGSLDTVVDIGAHIGTFAVRAAPLAQRVLSYEPMPESYDLLVRNVSRFSNVKAYCVAVAGRCRTATLFLGSNPGRNSLFRRQPGTSGPSIAVECTTLADIFAEHEIDRCDLLKLDCEGAEYEILYEAPKELWPRIDRICMEYHPVTVANKNWSGEGLVEYLTSVGHEPIIYPSKKQPQQGILCSVRKRASV